MTDQFSDSVRAKAARYVREGRVMQDAEAPEVWWVEGSEPNRPYRVQVTLDGADVRGVVCTCAHGKNTPGRARCTHALAALAGLADQRRGNR